MLRSSHAAVHGVLTIKLAYSKALHIHGIQHVKNNDKRSTRARVPIETAKCVVYAVVGLR
jgi:hypothetical protein